MTAIPVYVSLDLETTGLDPDVDSIIEISAVKFQGREEIDSYTTLVNPHRVLPFRIRMMCGITQNEVDNAPDFSEVIHELASFLGSHGIVGHSISFDMGFLSANGLKLANPTYDTYELANLFVTNITDYSLVSIAQKLGLHYPEQHRALPDAIAARDVFLTLIEKASQMSLNDLSEIERLVSGSGLLLERLLSDIKVWKAHTAFTDSGKTGETVEVPKALGKADKLIPSHHHELLNIEALTEMLKPEGALAKAFPGYEYRTQQIDMMQAIAGSLNKGEHFLVEAGTGTGKSISYLLPSMMFAKQNNVHIVISTNTINLQDQLLTKDIPDLTNALGVNVTAVQLKGRSNYLCRRRLSILKRSSDLSNYEIMLLIRIMIWLPTTRNGDKAELNISNEQVLVWNRVCAQADNCLGGSCQYFRQGICFLYSARQAAEGAHLVIVNHALLLTDIAVGSSILPEYNHLIIDEAHHLEEEATEQFGFKMAQRHFIDHIKRLTEDIGGQHRIGLLHRIVNSLSRTGVSKTIQDEVNRLIDDMCRKLDRTKSRISEFFNALKDFIELHSEDRPQNGYEVRLRITSGIRIQPGWYQVETTWENIGLLLKEIDADLGQLYSKLEVLSENKVSNYQDIMPELQSITRFGMELCDQVNALVFSPEKNFIYWVSLDSAKGAVTLFSAPEHVGALLDKAIFSKIDSVVLTSATLSTDGTFDYIKERLGLDYVNELILEAPFDYKKAVMIYVPRDIPEPGKKGYQQVLEKGIINLCLSTQGRTLILFTSHAALRATYSAVKQPLEREAISILGQGLDGSPKKLLAAFKKNPKAVLMGTASFWEGIDIVGEALSVLVIVRLPFSVPTDPVFAARSEMFDDPFHQYAVPQAILKFKQGFGRLIRARTDQGVLVVFDRRVQSKRYGPGFISSLPPCTVLSASVDELPRAATRWLNIRDE